MAHQAGGREHGTAPGGPRDPEVYAYLRDYATLVNAVPFPSAVFDHRWDVVLVNRAFDALFREVGSHPTAMPGDNFMRFVLFHPDAGKVLGEHESSWCLPMLAYFARAMEQHAHDPVLQSIGREIALDPIMEAAYREGLPHWLRAVGPGGVKRDGSELPLRHPDPRWGHSVCRVVGTTPRTLSELGYRHLTLVLREPRMARRSRGHLRAVPAGG